MYLYWITALSCPENYTYDILTTTLTSGSSYYYSVRIAIMIAIMRIVYIVTNGASPDILNFTSQKCRVSVCQHAVLRIKAWFAPDIRLIHVGYGRNKYSSIIYNL